jgi:CRP-like cAMP-binding protein
MKPSFADPAWRATTPALAVLEQFSTIISVQRDGQIHDQGDKANYCYKVLSGCVRTVHLMEDGRRQVDES